jgi:hypothetical protein
VFSFKTSIQNGRVGSAIVFPLPEGWFHSPIRRNVEMGVAIAPCQTDFARGLSPMEMQLGASREKGESSNAWSNGGKPEEMVSPSLAKTPDASERSRMQEGAGVSLGEILKEQAAEMRAMRVLLESMDKKLKAVCEIAEARAISFARRDSQAGGKHIAGLSKN